MAKVERRVIPPKPVEPQVDIVITLTEDEALELAGILGNGLGLVNGLYLKLADTMGSNIAENKTYQRGKFVKLSQTY